MIYNPIFNCTEFDAIEIRIEVSCRRTSSRKRAELWHKKSLTNTFTSMSSSLNVIPLGFEPKTHSLEGCCSIQLSYGTITFASAKIVKAFEKTQI